MAPTVKNEPPCSALLVSAIEPPSGWQPIDMAELWRYRELAWFFAWRDIKVRYKQTELGLAWAVLEPLLTTGVFTLLFGLFMGRGNEPGTAGLPYALSTFAGMILWHFFAASVARSSESLIQAQNVITKVYFPRMLLPVAAMITALVDFAVGAVVLGLLMAWNGIAPGWPVLAMPLLLALALAAALAVGLWLSALSAMYRDFRYAQPFVVQLGLFLSPVFYATAKLAGRLPDWALALYSLNPMVGAIEGWRWAVLGAAAPPAWMVVPSVAMTALLLVGGLFFFRRVEQSIADVI